MDVEEFFGCQCHSVHHIVQFGYFFSKEEDLEEEDVIYFSVKTEPLFDRIFPTFSLNPSYWWDDIKNYVEHHVFKRIPIAIKYILNPYYIRRWGVTDCFDFQTDKLLKMKEVLSYLTTDQNCENPQSILYLNNRDWQLRFTIGQLDKEWPHWLGWDIQFPPEQLLFSRIKFAYQYIFGIYCSEESFEINKIGAEKLKGMIDVTRKLNPNEC